MCVCFPGIGWDRSPRLRPPWEAEPDAGGAATSKSSRVQDSAGEENTYRDHGTLLPRKVHLGQLITFRVCQNYTGILKNEHVRYK